MIGSENEASEQSAWWERVQATKAGRRWAVQSRCGMPQPLGQGWVPRDTEDEVWVMRTEEREEKEYK